MHRVYQQSLREVTTGLMQAVPPEALNDLRTEDTVAAIEVHFAPVRLRELPPAAFVGSECSVDGYYEAIADQRRPWILFAGDVAAERVRFTVIHELGHHLFATSAAYLLDALDRVGGSAEAAAQAEETVCHQFAGRVLVPEEALKGIVGPGPLSPRHVAQLKEETTASWEAIAVAAVAHLDKKAAVVLIREPGRISFAAAHGMLAWKRGSPVAPRGPLDRALSHNSTARPETYRHGQGYAESLFCDTVRVHDELAIGVFSSQPSDRHFEILEQPEPAWKQREDFCEWCGSERNVGWCDLCSGRKCGHCGRCGCATLRENPLCPDCFRRNPMRSGARVCVDCEADGVS